MYTRISPSYNCLYLLVSRYTRILPLYNCLHLLVSRYTRMLPSYNCLHLLVSRYTRIIPSYNCLHLLVSRQTRTDLSILLHWYPQNQEPWNNNGLWRYIRGEAHKFHKKGITHLAHCPVLLHIVCLCTVQLSLASTVLYLKLTGVYSKKETGNGYLITLYLV